MLLTHDTDVGLRVEGLSARPRHFWIRANTPDQNYGELCRCQCVTGTPVERFVCRMSRAVADARRIGKVSARVPVKGLKHAPLLPRFEVRLLYGLGLGRS